MTSSYRPDEEEFPMVEICPECPDEEEDAPLEIPEPEEVPV